MYRTLLAGTAGLLLALTGVATANAAPVTVRVEGAGSTLVRSVDVDPATVATVTRDGYSCNGNSAAGALELATGGDWAGSNGGFDIFVDAVKGEAHEYSQGAYWSLLVDDAPSSAGVCGTPAQEGTELTFIAQCATGVTTGCVDTAAGVMDASAAAVTRLGQPLAVTVTQTTTTYDADFNPVTTRGPGAGVTVAGGGASATADTSGIARITLNQRGPVELVAGTGTQVRDEVTTCVTDGADGYCGTTAPDGTTLPPSVGGSAAPATTPDKSAPQSAITGLREGQVFRKRKNAPRRLQASVSDPSGLLQVKLSLTRKVGGKCAYFSGKAERFKAIRCGKHPVFKLDKAADVDYLLPSRLGKGRYVFDVIATDKAYNRDTLARGRNRVVFTVR